MEFGGDYSWIRELEYNPIARLEYNPIARHRNSRISQGMVNKLKNVPIKIYKSKHEHTVKFRF